MSASGQTEKNSVRAYVFRFALELGHCSMQSVCLKRATSGSRSLFNHLVSAGNNRIWNAQAKRCCRFEVQGKFESDRLFNREFGWASSPEDFVDVLRGLAKHRPQNAPVAREPTQINPAAVLINCRYFRLCRQRRNCRSDRISKDKE